FVLMGNHFHLIAQTRRPNLTRWMHWLSVGYTVYFNRRHERSGHLFQGRFKSFLLQESEGYVLTLSRYVHLNPVRGISLGLGTPYLGVKALSRRSATELGTCAARAARSVLYGK